MCSILWRHNPSQTQAEQLIFAIQFSVHSSACDQLVERAAFRQCYVKAVVLTPLVADDGSHRMKLLCLDTAITPAKVG